MIDSVFQKVPFCGDDTENESVLKFVFKLHQSDEATCNKYMGQIARTAVKVIAVKKCADGMVAKFKREVG